MTWIGRGSLRCLRADLFRYSCPFDVALRPQASRGALAEAFLQDLSEVYGLAEDESPADLIRYIDDHPPFD